MKREKLLWLAITFPNVKFICFVTYYRFLDFNPFFIIQRNKFGTYLCICLRNAFIISKTKFFYYFFYKNSFEESPSEIVWMKPKMFGTTFILMFSTFVTKAKTSTVMSQHKIIFTTKKNWLTWKIIGKLVIVEWSEVTFSTFKITLNLYFNLFNNLNWFLNYNFHCCLVTIGFTV